MVASFSRTRLGTGFDAGPSARRAEKGERQSGAGNKENGLGLTLYEGSWLVGVRDGGGRRHYWRARDSWQGVGDTSHKAGTAAAQGCLAWSVRRQGQGSG
ncbi:hypothetical protein E2562_039389 [Oryza meyeriana var. granulata]|uniref:Uncharacterized protein n=1 Tax=Oryza meyeriana var. granulata TaxID=110450 RepID=A0A6G1EUH0_9ORYZ|nr:hypothetical protein E2562_039389 [Oryza meyeriana var. granulata]